MDQNEQGNLPDLEPVAPPANDVEEPIVPEPTVTPENNDGKESIIVDQPVSFKNPRNDEVPGQPPTVTKTRIEVPEISHNVNK